jgi:small conductance mechanosensitive channel
LAKPACASEDGSWCQKAYELTGVDWLSRSAGTLVDGAIAVIGTVLVAVLLRWLAHRAISHLTDEAASGTPRILRPLKDRTKQRKDIGVATLNERRAQRARAIGSVLRSLSSVIIYGVAFVMVLDEFGLNLAPILASASVLGLAIGFGAQSLVRDFLSGIFMMLEDQYGVGDTVDLGEAVGDVEAVGLRVTKLRDIAGTVWYVRNGEILRVGNSSQGFAVAVVDIPVAHGANLAKANEVIGEAASQTASNGHAADVIDQPEVLGVQEITPYSVTLRVTVKTRPGRQWAVQRTMRAKLMAALDEARVPTPNPNVTSAIADGVPANGSA